MGKTNIRVLRICQYCNAEFIAHTTVTKYCGDHCAKRAYKKRKQEEKISKTAISVQEQIGAVLKREKTSKLNDREFLSIQQVVDLLGSSRMTVHRLTKTGKLRTLKYGRRVIISRSDVNKMLKI